MLTKIISLQQQLPLQWLQDTNFSNTKVKLFTKTLRAGLEIPGKESPELQRIPSYALFPQYGGAFAPLSLGLLYNLRGSC